MLKIKQALKFITITVMAGCTTATILDRIKVLSTLPLANYLGVYVMTGMLLGLTVYAWTLPEKKEEKKVGNYFKK